MSGDKNSFKYKFTEEKNKIKQMDTKHKISYFKSYYLAPVLVILVAIACLAWFIYDTQITNSKIYYSGVLIAVNISEEGSDFLTYEFDDVSKHTRKYKSYLYDELYIPQSEDRTKVEGTDYVDIVLGESIAAGEFNYFLIDEDMIDHYDNMNFFEDIKDIADTYNIPESDRYIGKDGNIIAVKLSDDICSRLGLEAWNVGVYYAVIHNSDEYVNDKLFRDRLFGVLID